MFNPRKPWMHFMLPRYSFAFLAKRNLRVNAYYISGAMPTVYWLPLPRLMTNCIRDTVKFSAASLACFHGETAALGRNLLRCFKKPKVRLNCNEVTVSYLKRNEIRWIRCFSLKQEREKRKKKKKTEKNDGKNLLTSVAYW